MITAESQLEFSQLEVQSSTLQVSSLEAQVSRLMASPPDPAPPAALSLPNSNPFSLPVAPTVHRSAKLADPNKL